MKELIYSEKYLKFIYQIFDGQIEAGKMIPAWVFKSDKKSCPVGRFEKLENEIRQTLLIATNPKSYYSELASLKTLIEKVDLKAKEINVLHSEGKTDILKYLNYSYSNENFSLVYTMEGVKFKHETRHDYFGIIQYFRRVYQILEPLQQPPATIAGFKTNPISLTEILFNHLVKSFEKFKKQGTRPPYFIISCQSRVVDLPSFLDDAMVLQPTEPRLKRLHDLSNILLSDWNNNIFPLTENVTPYCFEIIENQVRIKTNSKTPIEGWFIANEYPEHLIFDELMNFVNQVKGYIEAKSGLQKTKQTGFKTTLPPDKLKPLFTRLIETGYIAPGTDFKSFTACFNGLPLPDNFASVQWIKRPKRGKNAPAKKALTDLLFLMGTPKEQTRDNSKLKTFFVDYTGNPLIFTQSNFDNSKDFKDNSEYFPELQNIINSL